MKTHQIMRIFLTLVLLSSTIGSIAQNNNVTLNLGGVICSSTIDSEGNLYVAGCFNGIMDADLGSATYDLVANGFNNSFIQKLDSKGKLIWAISFEGKESDGHNIVQDITLDKFGNVLITGLFSKTVDFDPGAGVREKMAIGLDIFIVKLNCSGELSWVKTFGASSDEKGCAISTDENENVIVSGTYQTTIDFNPQSATGLVMVENKELLYDRTFILKLDKDGNYLWVKSFGAGYTNTPSSVKVGSDNSIYVAGMFYSRFAFSTEGGIQTMLSKGGTDIFVIRVSSNGNIIWSIPLGGNGSEIVGRIVLDKDDNVYVSGSCLTEFKVPENTGGELTIANESERGAFLVKLKRDGKTDWKKILPKSSESYARAVTLTPDNHVLVAGTFEAPDGINHIFGDTNYISNLFVDKITPLGNTIWTRSFERKGISHFPVSVTCDSLENIYITGDDHNLREGWYVEEKGYRYHQRYFIQNMNQRTTKTNEETIVACSTYTWPKNGITYTESGQYFATIKSAFCDSLIKLNLILNPNSSGTDVVNSCSSYQWKTNGEFYHKTGKYTTTLVNSLGCDSIATLDLTINSSEQIEEIICNNAYTWPANGKTYTEPGTYQSFFTNHKGCDSVLTLNLFVNQLESTQLVNSEIASTENDSKIAAYPNPTEGNFNVDLGKLYETITVTITDMNEKIISISSFKNRSLVHLELEEASGVYSVKVEADNAVQLVKIIKY